LDPRCSPFGAFSPSSGESPNARLLFFNNPLSLKRKFLAHDVLNAVVTGRLASLNSQHFQGDLRMFRSIAICLTFSFSACGALKQKNGTPSTSGLSSSPQGLPSEDVRSGDFSREESAIIGPAFEKNNMVPHRSNPRVHGRTHGPALVLCNLESSGFFPAASPCAIFKATQTTVWWDMEGNAATTLRKALLGKKGVPQSSVVGSKLIGPVLVTCDEMISDPMPNSQEIGSDFQCRFSVDVVGKTFCRTIPGDGLFGQPKVDREHCVSFTDTTMTDNANTFFGNPPETLAYKIEDDGIYSQRQGQWQFEYRVSGTTIVNSEGAVLKLSN
jgi:hypothetical protein